jgi:hypothetical protein
MRTPAARVLRTGTFRDAWLVVGGAVISRGQGSTGDGCSVRDLGCIVSVRGICNRQHTETRTLLARLSLFFLIFSSDRPSICTGAFAPFTIRSYRVIPWRWGHSCDLRHARRESSRTHASANEKEVPCAAHHMIARKERKEAKGRADGRK